jgi:hypothetical protein
MQAVAGAPAMPGQPTPIHPQDQGQQQGMSQGDQMIVKLLEPMFRQTNPAQIVQGIMRRRPDLDPAVAFEAAQQILKMGTAGSAQDRGLAALLLRDVISQRHEAGATERTGMQVAGRGEVAAGHDVAAGERAAGRDATTQRGQDLRDQRARDAEKGRNQRFDARQTRLEAAKNAPGAALNQKGASLRSLLREIDLELQTAPEEDVSELHSQRLEVMRELRKLSGLAPPPAPTTQEEGGGASTTLSPQ